MALAGSPQGLFLLIWLALSVVTIWGIIDAAGRPTDAWDAAGQNKVLWIALQALGLIVTGFGGVLGVIYLAAIRRKLQEHEAARPPEEVT